MLNTYVQSRAQKYSAQDTLRGSITPERIWWDLVYYDLDVTVQPKVKSIRGTNTIHYKVVSPNNIMQIDLQPPMKLIKAVQDEVELSINQNGNAHFIQLEKKQNRKKIEQIVLHFEGQPKEAINAPWDGGFSWKKNYNDNDFI
ncbi:MAG: M1 family peptidase, partial [Flavobacteriaceae bacterium]|nr:M1 family peptidase [Flavobacteriaceae bacterium]